MYKKIKLWVKNNWGDPVWSAVIAGIILTALALIVKWIFNIPVKPIFLKLVSIFTFFFNWLLSYSNVMNWMIFIAVLALLLILYRVIIKLYHLFKVEEVKPKSSFYNKISESSQSFFDYRVAQAFPGVRGFKWIDSPKEAMKSLNVLLKHPVIFQSKADDDCRLDPVYWVRAGDSMHISTFKALSKTKCLINIDELNVKRLAVYRADNYKFDFIYIEVNGEKQIGINRITKENIIYDIDNFGYSSEEYAIFNKRVISRSNYDDGSTIVKDKIVNTSGATLRRRFLSNYNLFIIASDSIYNSAEFDKFSENYLNLIIKGERTFEEMFEEMKKRKFIQ